MPQDIFKKDKYNDGHDDLFGQYLQLDIATRDTPESTKQVNKRAQVQNPNGDLPQGRTAIYKSERIG